MKKICVCGFSAIPPLCDGAHQVEGWQCVHTGQSIDWAFMSTPALSNLADRLADHYNGSVVSADQTIECRSLVLISEAGALTAGKVHAERSIQLLLDFEPLWLLPLARPSHKLISASQISLWDQALTIINNPVRWHIEDQVVPPVIHSIFLSHAVNDEMILEKPIQCIRAMGHHVFTCADSIQSGHHWADEIRNALEESDHVVVVGSKQQRMSQYCAYELGYAHALHRPLSIILLDECPPMDPISHLQATSIPRLLKRKPWLTMSNGIIEGLLSSINHHPLRKA